MSDEFENRPPSVMNNPDETEEMKRLRKHVIDNLGDTEFELTALSAGENDQLIGVFTRKSKKSNAI